MGRQASWKVVFTKRTHAAAQYAKSLHSESVWIEEGPCEVVAAILRDKECIVS